MTRNRASRAMVLAVAAGGLLAACSLNPKEDPTRYYTLAMLGENPGLYDAAGLVGDTEEEASLSAGPHLPISVGVGPITIPGYLTRMRMVTRQSDSEIKYLETARWAPGAPSATQRMRCAASSLRTQSTHVCSPPSSWPSNTAR